MEKVREIREGLQEQIGRVVLGLEEIVDALIVGLLAEGHVLLEGVPGTAKTLLARVFARSLDLEFKRVQFTPDLMPADILGTNIFHFQTGKFVLTRGPVFTSFLLADEINRTPPKTQAALLEAMQERAVTIDGTSYPLSPLFMVVATQNPIEQEGTYALPEAQLDRFLFKLKVGFPSESQERDLVRIHGQGTVTPNLEALGIQPIITSEELVAARREVDAIRLSDENVEYIVGLVRATRAHPQLLHGASPRASNMLASAARAYAALDGRDYVIPDDVKFLFIPALRHRVVMTSSAQIEGVSSDTVLRNVMERVASPR